MMCVHWVSPLCLVKTKILPNPTWPLRIVWFIDSWSSRVLLQFHPVHIQFSFHFKTQEAAPSHPPHPPAPSRVLEHSSEKFPLFWCSASPLPAASISMNSDLCHINSVKPLDALLEFSLSGTGIIEDLQAKSWVSHRFTLFGSLLWWDTILSAYCLMSETSCFVFFPQIPTYL